MHGLPFFDEHFEHLAGDLRRDRRAAARRDVARGVQHRARRRAAPSGLDRARLDRRSACIRGRPGPAGRRDDEQSNSKRSSRPRRLPPARALCRYAATRDRPSGSAQVHQYALIVESGRGNRLAECISISAPLLYGGSGARVAPSVNGGLVPASAAAESAASEGEPVGSLRTWRNRRGSA